MTMHRMKPLSENQRRKRYQKVVSRSRKYIHFEIESWKTQNEEEQCVRTLVDELDAISSQHFAEI